MFSTRWATPKTSRICAVTNFVQHALRGKVCTCDTYCGIYRYPVSISYISGCRPGPGSRTTEHSPCTIGIYIDVKWFRCRRHELRYRPLVRVVSHPGPSHVAIAQAYVNIDRARMGNGRTSPPYSDIWETGLPGNIASTIPHPLSITSRGRRDLMATLYR